MENFILDLLKKSGADGWAVRDEIRTGWEFYFIRHALDQNRVRETEHITLTIYKAFEENGKKFLGSASAEIAPTATEAEAEGLIRSLLFEAGLIRNPYYALNQPRGDAAPMPDAPDVAAIAGDFLRAMKSVDEDAGAFVNSYEIFTDSVCCRLVTSTG
ncbi:MAG: TldD/PmbA family protein, partial [Kiritimatiellae bacterium]|nr:TldD/PmbA family protein [Kiritimatiellia bacterium]